MSAQASPTTTCRTCGASLAPDQRYCLACGARVAAPRLDFVAETERMETEPQAEAPLASAPAGAPQPSSSRLDKVGGPMGAAAVVLVALGVGFLIGQGSGETPAVTQPAPVVNVTGGVGGGAAPVTEDAGAGGGTGGSGDAAGGGRAGRASSDRGAADDADRVLESIRDIPTSDGSEDTGGDITRLRQLPDETATPGAPPPKDDKEAGGGTEAFEIG